jgi:hypothetical protein
MWLIIISILYSVIRSLLNSNCILYDLSPYNFVSSYSLYTFNVLDVGVRHRLYVAMLVTSLFSHPPRSDFLNICFLLCGLYYILHFLRQHPPITVAARSKAWTVFARSNPGIGGSNPPQGMDVNVCVYSVFALPCVQVAALRRAYHSSKESYRLCKEVITELKKRPGALEGL